MEVWHLPGVKGERLCAIDVCACVYTGMHTLAHIHSALTCTQHMCMCTHM